jgi:TPR repeat protein
MIGSASRTFLVLALAVAASGALAADPPQSASADEAAKREHPADLRGLSLEDLRRRANANELPAMEEIGRRLIQGLNAPKDPQAGAGWLLRAAEMGSVHAAFSVGVMYERGFVVARDSMRAVEWYRKAADGNVPMAKHNLALMLRDGKGTPRDGKAAVELLREAARQGMAASMFVLGDIYERGDAGSKDAIAALAWFSIAAEFERQTNQGNETPLVNAADQRSQTIQRTLTPGELLRAQGIAQSEFKLIVDALSPPKPTERIEAPVAPAQPPAVTDDEAVGWPPTAVEQV